MKKLTVKRGEYFRSGYAYLACKIGPTRFKDERAVYIERLDQGTTVTICERQEVKPSCSLAGIIPGEIMIRVVCRIKDGFLIDPPGQVVNSGGRIPVSQTAVNFR